MIQQREQCVTLWYFLVINEIKICRLKTLLVPNLHKICFQFSTGLSHHVVGLHDNVLCYLWTWKIRVQQHSTHNGILICSVLGRWVFRSEKYNSLFELYFATRKMSMRKLYAIFNCFILRYNQCFIASTYLCPLCFILMGFSVDELAK